MRFKKFSFSFKHIYICYWKELHETQTKQTKLLTDDEDTNDKKENEIPLEVLSRFAQKVWNIKISLLNSSF